MQVVVGCRSGGGLPRIGSRALWQPDGTATAVVHASVVGTQDDGERIAGLKLVANSCCLMNVVIGMVREIAILMDDVKSHPECRNLSDRYVDKALRTREIIISERNADTGRKTFEPGRVCDYVDRTTVRVPAIEGPLGTLEHLNSCDIVKVRANSVWASHINPVDIEGHTGGGEGAVGEAADTTNEDLITDTADANIKPGRDA